MAVGIFLNAFIILMNFIWWLKERSFQSIDLILSSLGLSRLLFLFMWAINDSNLVVLGWLLDSKYFLPIFSIATTFVSFCCLWTGTLLCVFYCVKITTYSHRFFLYLKLNISRLVPRLLLASVTISFFSSLPFGWSAYGTASNSTNVSSTFYYPQINVQKNYFYLFIFTFSGSLVPIIIFCTAVSLLIGSLWSHTSRMKGMDAGFRNPRLEALARAVRNMLSFVFFYLIYIGSTYLTILSLHFGNKVWEMIFICCTYACPSLHSIVLILSHRRLNLALRRITQWEVGKKKILFIY
ncbi:taste receptor type 2 member 4-like [Pelodytes ibericus]